MDVSSRLHAFLIQDSHRSRYVCKTCVDTIRAHEKVDAENPEVLQPAQERYECSECGVSLPWV